MTKTAFISIVGRPNVGKSTMMNSIIGEKIAIVSKKPQNMRQKTVLSIFALLFQSARIKMPYSFTNFQKSMPR